MKRIVAWLAWISIALVAALVLRNLPAMMEPAPFNLVFTEVQLPLGLLALALAALPLALFLLAYLNQQISTLVETRRLLRELQRAHERADQAEASRIEALRQWLEQEFRTVHRRLDGAGAEPAAEPPTPGPPSALRRALSAPWRGEARIF